MTIPLKRKSSSNIWKLLLSRVVPLQKVINNISCNQTPRRRLEVDRTVSPFSRFNCCQQPDPVSRRNRSFVKRHTSAGSKLDRWPTLSWPRNPHPLTGVPNNAIQCLSAFSWLNDYVPFICLEDESMSPFWRMEDIFDSIIMSIEINLTGGDWVNDPTLTSVAAMRVVGVTILPEAIPTKPLPRPPSIAGRSSNTHQRPICEFHKLISKRLLINFALNVFTWCIPKLHV